MCNFHYIRGSFHLYELNYIQLNFVIFAWVLRIQFSYGTHLCTMRGITVDSEFNNVLIVKFCLIFQLLHPFLFIHHCKCIIRKKVFIDVSDIRSANEVRFYWWIFCNYSMVPVYIMFFLLCEIRNSMYNEVVSRKYCGSSQWPLSNAVVKFFLFVLFFIIFDLIIFIMHYLVKDTFAILVLW